jgi:hypothetical protein
LGLQLSLGIITLILSELPARRRLCRQLLNTIAVSQGLKTTDDLQFVDNKAMGDFLKGKVLSIGKKYRWMN